jgi:S1-C subfamily serine protease
MILDVEPGGPASIASFLPGDILLGTEEKTFSSVEDLSQELEGAGPRLLRLEFLRGNYSQVRRVAVQLGIPDSQRSSVAA